MSRVSAGEGGGGGVGPGGGGGDREAFYLNSADHLCAILRGHV